MDTRREQAEATRELLLRAAERLFAERGLAQVSNRQIVEAAGQANNSALAYHVGSRTALIQAITRSHVEPIAERMRERVGRTRRSARPRDHVASLVLPYTEHLASLGNPSWCARFLAQVVTDPALIDVSEAVDPVLAVEFVDGSAAVWQHVAELPAAESALRRQTARVAVIHTCAEQERVAAATGAAADWSLVGEALTDALTGMLTASRHHPEGH
ncbi:TetR/AcrR family transcriptional regulator [Amycolatopsis jiangsuensis]|uniref:AcrR family transcriptional regulator n=1 Tax=Amycolatopsis jiangsuensis TaxID=1181879 RepID=A0A840IR30_9PSEU|nr:TetR family transcriptional regulator [Amycolatopsis jiangsuensis]MBB4683905.1 AcrR family transcriptional regulator [Amycolatopsis jiangsuensis]